LRLKKHLISIKYLTGETIEFFKPPTTYSEFALVYGRQIVHENRFTLECFAGVGYLFENQVDNKNIRHHFSTPTIPMDLRFDFRIYQKLSAGAQVGYNLNKIEPFRTLGLNIGLRF